MVERFRNEKRMNPVLQNVDLYQWNLTDDVLRRLTFLSAIHLSKMNSGGKEISILTLKSILSEPYISIDKIDLDKIDFQTFVVNSDCKDTDKFKEILYFLPKESLEAPPKSTVVWALGVFLFFIVEKTFPTISVEEFKKCMSDVCYSRDFVSRLFIRSKWKHISKEMFELISSMLTFNNEMNLTLELLVQHDLFRDQVGEFSKEMKIDEKPNSIFCFY